MSEDNLHDKFIAKFKNVFTSPVKLDELTATRDQTDEEKSKNFLCLYCRDEHNSLTDCKTESLRKNIDAIKLEVLNKATDIGNLQNKLTLATTKIENDSRYIATLKDIFSVVKSSIDSFEFAAPEIQDSYIDQIKKACEVVFRESKSPELKLRAQVLNDKLKSEGII